MKLCTKCKEEKDLNSFTKDKWNKDGLSQWCRPCKNASKAAWKERNKERVSEYDKQYSAEYRKENPEKVAESYADWAKRNRPLLNEKNRRREAAKENATPGWAEVETMKNVYLLAEEETRETGIAHHVDHIVPLTSDRVCGFHVACNLQVLTKFENLSKGNRWWPDMWDEE